MLETSYLARTYTHICSFRKYIFECQGAFHFADASSFLQKNNAFWPKIVALLKAIVSELC